MVSKKTVKSQPPKPKKLKKYEKPLDEEIIKLLFEKSEKLLLPSTSNFIVGTKKIKNYSANVLTDFIQSHSFKRIFYDVTNDKVEIHVSNMEADPFLYLLK